jgi:putative FmdB family regulatory protein
MEMPTYEYKCDSCGHCFEVFHGVNESVDACEACGSRVRRVFHPVGVIFKGSGFYVTDSRGGNGKGGKGSAGSDAGGSAKRSEDKQETSSPGASASSKQESD